MRHALTSGIPTRRGSAPPVDLRLRLGEQDYAIEHTRIESFGNQIGTVTVANRIVRHVRKSIPDSVPRLRPTTSCSFGSTFPCPEEETGAARALNSLVQWVCAAERRPARPESGYGPGGARYSSGQRWDPGNARRIRLRVPAVALADRAAHSRKSPAH